MSKLKYYFPDDPGYDFKNKPSRLITKSARWLRNLGHMPFRPLQPNGWSDFEADWVSPEFLFRRIGLIKIQQNKSRLDHCDINFLKEIIFRNFNDFNEVFNYVRKVNNKEQTVALFSSKWMLKT